MNHILEVIKNRENELSIKLLERRTIDTFDVFKIKSHIRTQTIALMEALIKEAEDKIESNKKYVDSSNPSIMWSTLGENMILNSQIDTYKELIKQLR